MRLEPLDCPLEPFLEPDLRFPVHQLSRARHIQAPTRLPVGLGGVPADLLLDRVLVGEPGELGDQVHEIADRDLHVGAQVDRGRVVHLFRGRQDPVGAVLDEEELA